MARITRSVSKKEASPAIKEEDRKEPPATPPRPAKRTIKLEEEATETPSTLKKIKLEELSTPGRQVKSPNLQAKKLKAYAEFANKSPFPDFKHPDRKSVV